MLVVILSTLKIIQSRSSLHSIIYPLCQFGDLALSNRFSSAKDRLKVGYDGSLEGLDIRVHHAKNICSKIFCIVFFICSLVIQTNVRKEIFHENDF